MGGSSKHNGTKQKGPSIAISNPGGRAASVRSWPMHVLPPNGELAIPGGPFPSTITNLSSNKSVTRVKTGEGDIATYNEGDAIQLLYTAALDRDLPLLEELVPLLETADLNSRHPFGVDGKAALHWAARGGCLRCIKILVEAGALVDITDTGGRTPLHGAVSNGFPYIVKYLVEQGANVNARTKILGTPLHMAAGVGLDEAATHARPCLEAAKLLIAAGAELDARDNFGATPLHQAACRSFLGLVRCLIAAGAQYKTQTITASNMNALQAMALGGVCEGFQSTPTDEVAVRHLPQFVETARVLIEMGADPHAKMEAPTYPLSQLQGSRMSALDCTRCKTGGVHVPGQLELAALIAELAPPPTATEAGAMTVRELKTHLAVAILLGGLVAMLLSQSR